MGPDGLEKHIERALEDKRKASQDFLGAALDQLDKIRPGIAITATIH
jgi:hypothetical protein